MQYMCFTKLPILQNCLLQITGLMGGNGLWKGHSKFRNQRADLSSNSSQWQQHSSLATCMCVQQLPLSVSLPESPAHPSSHGCTSSPGFISNRDQILQNSKPDLRTWPSIWPSSSSPSSLPSNPHTVFLNTGKDVHSASPGNWILWEMQQLLK